MKAFLKSFIIIALILLQMQGHSQDLHFVYIQSESNSPFYVKIHDKMINSSSTGYLILAKLEQGEHKIRVGFPEEKWPEQEVSINVETKDEGLILKNFPDAGWGLQSIRNSKVTMH